MDLKINSAYRRADGTRVIYKGLELFEEDGKYYHQFDYIKELKPSHLKNCSGYGQNDEQVMSERYKLDRGATILYSRTHDK